MPVNKQKKRKKNRRENKVQERQKHNKPMANGETGIITGNGRTTNNNDIVQVRKENDTLQKIDKVNGVSKEANDESILSIVDEIIKGVVDVALCDREHEVQDYKKNGGDSEEIEKNKEVDSATTTYLHQGNENSNIIGVQMVNNGTDHEEILEVVQIEGILLEEEKQTEIKEPGKDITSIIEDVNLPKGDKEKDCIKIDSITNMSELRTDNENKSIATNIDLKTLENGINLMDEVLSQGHYVGSQVCDVYIPLEIVSYILDYVDGKTLAICRQVCRDWKSLIDTSAPSGINRWLEVCIFGIPEEQIYDFIGHHSPKYWMYGADPLNYLNLFKRWSLWQYFLKRTQTVKRLGTTFKEIVCIKTSGDWLLIGSRNGHLNAYSFSMDILVQLTAGGPINSMYLRCTTEPDFVYDGALEKIGHDEVVLDLTAAMALRVDLHTIVATPLIKFKPYSHAQYIACDDLEVTADVSNFRTRFTSTFNDGHATKEFQGVFYVAHAWNGLVILVEAESSKMKVVDKYFEDVNHPFNAMHVDYNLMYRNVFIGVEAIFTFPYGCDLSHRAEVNVLGKTKIYRYYDFPIISCGFFYANHLFLGTIYGTVEVFYIENLVDLFELDTMDKKRRGTISMIDVRDPVVSMDVREAGKKTSILVATVSHLFEISFSLYENLSSKRHRSHK